MYTYLILVSLLAIGGFAIQMIAARWVPRPANLGVEQGRLAPCPASPNCVSTQAQDDQKKMAPIPFSCGEDEVILKIADYVKSKQRTKIIEQTTTYLGTVFRTRLIGYPDDVEFLVDGDDKVVHFRSASRIGYSDLGTNRRRMEKISKELAPLLK